MGGSSADPKLRIIAQKPCYILHAELRRSKRNAPPLLMCLQKACLGNVEPSGEDGEQHPQKSWRFWTVLFSPHHSDEGPQSWGKPPRPAEVWNSIVPLKEKAAQTMKAPLLCRTENISGGIFWQGSICSHQRRDLSSTLNVFGVEQEILDGDVIFKDAFCYWSSSLSDAVWSLPGKSEPVRILVWVKDHPMSWCQWHFFGDSHSTFLFRNPQNLLKMSK